MKPEIRDLRTILRLVGAALLLVGLTGALMIYLTAGKEDDDSWAYGDISGARPQDTKMYRHELELYGGKANVIAIDFARWIGSLWHGKALAFTVSCLTVFISCGCFFAAGRLQTGPGSENMESKRSGPAG